MEDRNAVNNMSKNGTLRVHRGARIAATIILLCLVGMPLLGQSNDIQYFYDDIGRLIKAVDQNGNVATYSYDAVGNLLSIARSTLPANNGLAILNFTPQSGPVGQSVTIQGQGFSTTVSSNTVQFNGVAAAVTAATASSLTVTVPFAATTGLISVTVSGQSASSTTPANSFWWATPARVRIRRMPCHLPICLGSMRTAQFCLRNLNRGRLGISGLRMPQHRQW
jgi:YD repeat-containing protein